MTWKPEYMEHYYTVDVNKLTKSKADASFTKYEDYIDRYLWLDLDDDVRLLKEKNVFKDVNSAIVAASSDASLTRCSAVCA